MIDISKPIIVSLLLGMLMTMSGVLTKAMMQAVQVDDQQDIVNFETIIPREFGDWKLDPTTAALGVNPDDKSLLNKLYRVNKSCSQLLMAEIKDLICKFTGLKSVTQQVVLISAICQKLSSIPPLDVYL